MNKKIKIGLVEDNRHLSESIAENLTFYEDIELVFIASGGKDGIQLSKTYQPDVMLIDINMPEMDGIETTASVLHENPGIKIIMLTVFDENDKIFNSILAGASGYLLKDEKPDRIVDAIREVLEGGAPMSPSIANKTIQLLKHSVPGKTKEEGSEKYNLSTRELEILSHISEGLNYQQIADLLFIAPKTVRNHIENIYSKLQVHNKVEAVRLALKHHII